MPIYGAAQCLCLTLQYMSLEISKWELGSFRF